MSTSNLQQFKQSLIETHYCTAFMSHLSNIIINSNQITTFQQINEMIKKESQTIIDYFNSNNSELKLIKYRNPLCFESLREYFQKIIRGVFKRYGSDIQKFREGLKITSKELNQVLLSATNRIVKNSELLLKDNRPKKILIYSYSRSIVLSLRKLHKSLEQNLQVYICRSGPLQQGLQLYQQLSLDGIRCKLISDNEICFYTSEIDCAIVGAQVILENGGIINRAGTYMVALACKDANKPLYVFAECYKYTRKIFLSQKDVPQNWKTKDQFESILSDMTPPQYISMFCLDNGIFGSDDVGQELSKILN